MTVNSRRIEKDRLNTVINQADQYFTRIKRNDNFDIPEETWKRTKGFLLKISKEFWKTHKKPIPPPKISFIEESIELRWERVDIKIILSFTSYFDDNILYIKKHKDQYINKSVPKNEISKHLVYWVNQL